MRTQRTDTGRCGCGHMYDVHEGDHRPCRALGCDCQVFIRGSFGLHISDPEFLYTRFEDEGGQMPDEWIAHRLLKRTPKFVYVARKLGMHEFTIKLPRGKLDLNGYAYWHEGRTIAECFYTEQGKLQFDARQMSYQPLPECLQALGLTRAATTEDVRCAFRKAALKEHPDTGGRHEGMLKLLEHYQTALRIVKS